LGEKLASFYTRFGFIPVSLQDVPSSMKFKFALPQLGKKLLGIPVTIMHYH
jgi:amino-acid N-acetyltransferase